MVIRFLRLELLEGQFEDAWRCYGKNALRAKRIITQRKMVKTVTSSRESHIDVIYRMYLIGYAAPSEENAILNFLTMELSQLVAFSVGMEDYLLEKRVRSRASLSERVELLTGIA